MSCYTHLGYRFVFAFKSGTCCVLNQLFSLFLDWLKDKTLNVI